MNDNVINEKWMVVIFVLSASFVVYKINVMDEIDLDMLLILFISFLSFLFTSNTPKQNKKNKGRKN